MIAGNQPGGAGRGRNYRLDNHFTATPRFKTEPARPGTPLIQKLNAHSIQRNVQATNPPIAWHENCT